MPHLLCLLFIFFLNVHVVAAQAQSPLQTMTACENLQGWGNSAKTTELAKEGNQAVVVSLPSGQTGFLSFNYENTSIDLTTKHSVSFWWQAQGTGLTDFKVKIRNYPIADGMEAVYNIWSGTASPDGWQLATIVLSEPQFDNWGGEPDLTRRYLTFRTQTEANSNVKLLIDEIVAIDATFEFELGQPFSSEDSERKADFDSDGTVGFADFILFANHFGLSESDTNFEPQFDFDTDGVIGFPDFVYFAQKFGSDGTTWFIPISFTNLTQSDLETTIGRNNLTYASQTFPPGQTQLNQPIPYNDIRGKDPADSFALNLWVQVSDFIQTRQSDFTYIPQEGISRTFQQFTEASANGQEPILPDFSYSGYHYFSKSIPTVTDSIFDVTSYGAIPNDILSDQTAIQRAIDAAERNGGGVVFFPAGEFLVNTDTDANQPITIRESNILLRGSGSRLGGTVIRQVNHMPPTNPDQLWTSPYMFKVHPLNTSDKRLTNISTSASRETFWLTVDDASTLFEGQWITLYMNSVSAIKDFLNPYQTETSWTTMRTNGIQVREKHKIAEIAGNRIRLNEPLHTDVNHIYDWSIREYQHVEEIGIEDISFHGSWLDEFVHHQDAIHDGGWSLLELNRCVNSWVRRVSFINCNRALNISSSSAISVFHVTQAGNKGHSSIASNGGYGVWVGLSEDLAEHHHGPGTSSRSVGTVYWRYDMQPNQRIDAHGAQPYANLLDRVNGGILYGSGASIENFPNHLKHYVLWNFKHRGTQNHYDFWQSGDARDRFVNPIIVGFHGDHASFNEAHLQVLESLGSPVKPESLFEAQLELRLNSVPEWLTQLQVEWEEIRQTPLPLFPETDF